MSDERKFREENNEIGNSEVNANFSWDELELEKMIGSNEKTAADAELDAILADFKSDEFKMDDFDLTGAEEKDAFPKMNDQPEILRADREPDMGPAAFELDFDFEKEYGEQQEEEVPVRREPRAVRRNREKKTGCLGGIMYFAFVLAVSIIFACLAWLAATDVLALGKEDEQVEVTIPDNYTMEEVINILYTNDLIRYKSLFEIYADFSSADEKICEGTYVLNKNYDYRALVNGMTEFGGVLVETEVTIPEGYTLMQIAKLLEENAVCSQEELFEAAANYNYDYDFLSASTLGDEKRLEGFLFPDTYIFYVNDDPQRVLDKMLENFNNRFNEEYVLRAEEMGYSIEDIITIASMIEKEAGSNDERALIASVIYNRLNSDEFPLLQIDATIYYATTEAGVEFTTEYDSPYNTYLYEGLPPGPIANPGMASIEAALYPESTEYYYYALRTDGVHEFFNYQDEFEAFVYSEEYGG